MKKIGILTFARVANFGANLQGLSTYNYLKNNGYIPIFIDWEPEDFAKRQEKEAKTIQGKAHFDFFDAHCIKTRKCRNEYDVAQVIEEENIEGIIIGSDAVLQHHPLITRIKFPTKRLIYIAKTDKARMYPNPFWGAFNDLLKKKIPLVIMSASSQNSPFKSFSHSIKTKMRKNLKSFTFISVRDNWTRDMIATITKNEIIPSITPDPVFAFNYNCSNLIPSKAYILKKFNLPENYYLVSFLNDKVVTAAWIDILNKKTTQKGYPCYALPMPDGIKFKHNISAIQPPLNPIDWYALIKYSNGYIGQNMHPIIVALHNSVPVFSFDSYGITYLYNFKTIKESSKIYHIMKEFYCEKNRVAVNIRRYSVPTPEYVLKQLDSFNKEMCNKISNKKYEEYMIMMKNIEEAFNIL